MDGSRYRVLTNYHVSECSGVVAFWLGMVWWLAFFCLIVAIAIHAEFYKELYYRLHLGTRFCHFGPFWPGGQNGKISETTEFLLKYSLIRKKSDSTILKNFVREKFRKQSYFFTCILPDYLSYESLKVFWKNSDFENMGASFLRRCQNTLRQNSLEMMHFQAWKKKFLTNIIL